MTAEEHSGGRAPLAPRLAWREPIVAHEAYPRTAARWIIPADGGWDDVALSEWDLRRAGWSDAHPHSETVIVLEGELLVESGGHTVTVAPGDTVTVPAGAIGRYWAPEYARMLSIYGPNPQGAPTPEGHYWELAEPDEGVAGRQKEGQNPGVVRSDALGMCLAVAGGRARKG